MSDVPLHTRETIEEDGANEWLVRYRVAGGWLYRTLVYDVDNSCAGAALCFVPDAKESQ